MVAGLQLRPHSVFPTQGTLQIVLTDDPPSVDQSRPTQTCHGNCSATSLVFTISSVEVHTSGINNMTGEWRVVCSTTVTVDVVQLGNLMRILCNTSIQPETITNIRVSVTSIRGNITGVGMRDLTLPSGHLEIPVSPQATVRAGSTTTIILDLQPHIVCTGDNGDCKLTPVLQASTQDVD